MNEVVISLISLGGIGLVFGIILSVLDKKLKVEEDPLVKEIMSLLPGINCGACGFAGCSAYAKQIAEKKDILKGCIPGGDAVNSKVSALIGVKAKKAKSLKVIVKCGAKTGEKKSSFDYSGVKSCAAADLSWANIDCRYGCLGFGDCVQVCPVQALRIEEQLVKVDYNKCIGCGKCVEVCPRNVLELVEVTSPDLYVVSCSNPDKALDTKKVCSKGCIGCGICVKLVKDSPFELKQGLSKLNYQKAQGRGKEELDAAKDKCPVKIINSFSSGL